MPGFFSRLFKGAGPETPTSKGFKMEDFGADSKSVVQRLAKAQNIQGAERPSNMWFRTNGQTAFWYQYALMDWYMSEVSVLSTVTMRSCTELLRYGIELTPRFVKKCTQCGYEAQTLIDKCPCCGSMRLRRPDMSQKDYFKRPNGKSFIEEANDNGQSLKDVLKAYALCEYQNNQAYTLCVTGDVIDPETGELVRGYPLEFVNIDPKFVRFLYDDTGKPGNKYAFTMMKRDFLITLGTGPNEYDTDDYLSQDGEVLYPAAWQVGENYGGTGRYILYALDEMYQDKWFKPSLVYGQPVWFDIEDDLLTYHYIEKHNLKKYKFGYVRKIIILPGFNDEDVEDITKGIQDVLATNDNSIPIVCTPPQMQGVAQQEAKALELGTESSADLMQIKNDIRDRICAHGGVPNLFAGDVEKSGGMNNESQQITAFDRYLMDKYDYLDRQLKWILDWFPNITDFELCVTRPSKASSGQRRRMDLIQEAASMAQLGFIPRWIDGEPRYPEISTQEIEFQEKVREMQEKHAMEMQQAMEAQQQQQAAAAQQQGGMPGAPGGAPGGGEELQDRGSARREDGEIADAKQSVDESAREAMGAFAASAGKRAARSYEYRKDLSDQGWLYLLAKDAYSFLGHTDKATREITRDLGKQVAPYFRTCSEEQAREIYETIVKEMNRSHWETSRLKKKVMEIAGDNEGFTEKDAQRIVTTELERVLCYAKEQFLKGTDEKVVWVGPMDERTTGMCAYAQSGRLGAKHADLKEKLPEWRKGFTVPELKEFLRKVHDVFYEAGVVNTPMISDWTMHINCRHTFQSLPEDEEAHDQEWHEVDVPSKPDVTLDAPGVAFEVQGRTYVSKKLGEKPVMFRFSAIGRDELARWAKTVALMKGSDDEGVIRLMLDAETALDGAEKAYIIDHAAEIQEALE